MPQDLKQKAKPDKSDLNEEKDLFVWQAPERSFKKRDRDFWITAIAILALVSIILFFAKETFLIVALSGALFLYYVLATVEPQTITNKLTNRGIYFGDLFYSWADLAAFWFGKSLDSQAIYFETYLRFPRQVSLIIDPKQQDTIKKIVVKKIPLIKDEPRFIDKATTWLMSKIPLEDKKSN